MSTPLWPARPNASTCVSPVYSASKPFTGSFLSSSRVFADLRHFCLRSLFNYSHFSLETARNMSNRGERRLSPRDASMKEPKGFDAADAAPRVYIKRRAHERTGVSEAKTPVFPVKLREDMRAKRFPGQTRPDGLLCRSVSAKSERKPLASWKLPCARSGCCGKRPRTAPSCRRSELPDIVFAARKRAMRENGR